VPLANPDFGAVPQRNEGQQARAVFVFVPAGQGELHEAIMPSAAYDKSGIKTSSAPGDVRKTTCFNGRAMRRSEPVNAPFDTQKRISRTPTRNLSRPTRSFQVRARLMA